MYIMDEGEKMNEEGENGVVKRIEDGDEVVGGILGNVMGIVEGREEEERVVMVGLEEVEGGLGEGVVVMVIEGVERKGMW